MSNQSELNTVMGNRNYSIESVTQGLGSTVSLDKLSKRIMVLPPDIKSATDRANIHYQGLRGVEEFAFAQGMISEAESFIENWPRFKMRFQSDKRAWSLAGVNVKLMTLATPEWVALTNIIALNKKYQQTLDPKVEVERNAIYQRWWGLIALPNPEKYQARGVAVTDEMQDEVLDAFSGFGRPQARQYYPTLTQAFLNRDASLLRVSLLGDTNKKGKIVGVSSIDGSPIRYMTQNPYLVDVSWDDGSRESLSYLGVRQLDPVLGEPMFCRAQQILSPYDNFGINTNNNFINKLATVLVLSALEIGFSYSNYTADQIVRRWTNMASGFIQPAAKSVTYSNMTEHDNKGKNQVGWATTLGKRIMEQIWGILMETGSLSNVGVKVREFMDKEIVLPLGTVTDSGLVLCPFCKKCENLTTANFVDFGIQTNDQDGFSSIAWQTRNVKGVPKFRAIGMVKCNGCSGHYYRKFHPSTRPFNNQISIGGVLTAPSPNLYLNMSQLGGTAGEAEIVGYSFIPRFEYGDAQSVHGLPVLRLFGELESNEVTKVRADDIPLEVGTQSRNLKKERWCSGNNPIHRWGSQTTSHEWFDTHIGNGDGEYSGTNIDAEAYSPARNMRTGLKRCNWCETVSTQLNTYISETWVTGRGSAATYSRESTKEFLQLKSASNNDIFNQTGVDYEATGGDTIDLGSGYYLEEPEHILYYKIRMLGEGGLVKILHIDPDDLGIEIPTIKGTPSILLKPIHTFCPNENAALLTPYRAFYEDYLKKEQEHFQQESRFLVTEQLAYSAYLNRSTKKWEAKTPPESYRGESGGYRNNLFNSQGVNKEEWADGNRESVTPQGSQPRFPEPKLGKGSAAAIITPYADNRLSIRLKQYHDLQRVGTDIEETVNEDSGQKLITYTPYYYCPDCNDSFHGAPTTDEAMIWKFPKPMGQEVLKNGWDINPKTNNLEFTPSKLETERRDDSSGGYNPKSKWHWTLPLYTQNTPFGTWLDSMMVNNPEKVRKLNFTPQMLKWIKAGQEFPADGGENNDGR